MKRRTWNTPPLSPMQFPRLKRRRILFEKQCCKIFLGLWGCTHGSYFQPEFRVFTKVGQRGFDADSFSVAERMGRGGMSLQFEIEIFRLAKKRGGKMLLRKQVFPEKIPSFLPQGFSHKMSGIRKGKTIPSYGGGGRFPFLLPPFQRSPQQWRRQQRRNVET